MTTLLKLTIIGLLTIAASGCALWQQTPSHSQFVKVKAYPKSKAQRMEPPGVCRVQAHAYYLNQKRMWVGDRAGDRQLFGLASWYGEYFHGRKTANGETYDMHASTAAHKSLPMNSLVEVTNLNNGRRTIVRINDRGPFIDKRIIDLSFGAANEINMVQKGVVPVRVLVLYWGDQKSRRVANRRDAS